MSKLCSAKSGLQIYRTAFAAAAGLLLRVRCRQVAVDVQGRRAHSPKCLQTQAPMQRAGRLAAALLSARHGAGRALLAPGACLRLQARVSARRTPSLRLSGTCAALKLGGRLRRCFARVRSSCTGTHAAATSHNAPAPWPALLMVACPCRVRRSPGGQRRGLARLALARPAGRSLGQQRRTRPLSRCAAAGSRWLTLFRLEPSSAVRSLISRAALAGCPRLQTSTGLRRSAPSARRRS